MKPTTPGRLHAQGLDRPRFDTAVEVVRHLGCVQSQLPDMALWGVARRTRTLTLADLRAAFDRGDVVRTHVLRPTWHLVHPDDLHDWLALTAPRVRRLLSSTSRSIGLDEGCLDPGAAVLLAALADGVPRTRAELATCLEQAGLPHEGQALAHVVMHAELAGLIASGPLRGKQHTYLPLPAAPTPPGPDELLAGAARRYARGHGPFRDRDLAWWASLTLTQSRRAVELADLRPREIGGHTHWHLDEPVDAEVPRVMLLPNFDEYVSYARDPDDFAAYRGSAQDIARVSGLVIVDGRFTGTWTRAVTATTVRIVAGSSVRMTGSARAALEREVEAFGRFVDREPELVLTD